MTPTARGLLTLPLLLPWLALAWNAPASGASSSDPDGNEPEEVSVDVTTTTPNRLNQPLSEVTGTDSVTVLTKPAIDSQQPLSVPEVLRDVPGLGLLESGTVGESTEIRLRGADSLQTLVLLDGVRINSPFRGFADVGGLLLDGIDQIEVVRGANSALYGSDAVGGVVNFRMLPPQRPSEVTVFAGGGTFRTAREGVDVASKGEWGHYRLALSRTDTDGQFDHDRFGATTVAAQVRVNLTANSYVMVTPRYQYEEKELALTPVEVLDPLPIVWDANNRFKQQSASSVLEYRNAVKPWWELVLHAAVVLSDIDWDNPQTTSLTSSGTVDYAYMEETRERQWTVNLQQNITWAERQVLTIGLEQGWVDVYSNQLLSFKIMPPALPTDPLTQIPAITEGRRRTRSLYIQQLFDWKSLIAGADRFKLQLGFRADGDTQFGSTVNPKVALSYDVPATGTTLRAGWGTGYRAPTIQELSFVLFANPALKPETSMSWEAGVRQPWLHERIVVDMAFFQLDFRDLIQHFPPPAHNVGTARSRGIETALTIRPVDAVELAANYTWFDTYQGGGGALPFTWRHQLSVAATYSPLVNLLIRADLYARSAQQLPVPGGFELQDGTIEQGESSGFIRVNLAVSYDLIHPGAAIQHVVLFVKATNLFNKEYEDVPGFPAPGLAFFGGMKSYF